METKKEFEKRIVKSVYGIVGKYMVFMFFAQFLMNAGMLIYIQLNLHEILKTIIFYGKR